MLSAPYYNNKAGCDLKRITKPAVHYEELVRTRKPCTEAVRQSKKTCRRTQSKQENKVPTERYAWQS